MLRKLENRDVFESKDAKWCIPTLFETLFGATERNISIVFYKSIIKFEN